VSFASEPGRDDGNLPPVNVVIPDDARELARDVLAYHREVRAQRRRQRLRRALRLFRASAFGGHAAIIPAIAICLAISLVGGALLSVATMSPASAPTTSPASTPTMSTASTPATSTARAPAPATAAGDLTELPSGTVELAGRPVAVRSLVISTIALVPANCDCDPQLSRLAGQAVAAHVGLYFAGAGPEIGQLPALGARYGDGAAMTVADNNRALTAAYRPQGLTILLVFKDARAEVIRTPGASFQLTAVMRALSLPAAAQRTAS
jgi:hypothetical protein